MSQLCVRAFCHYRRVTNEMSSSHSKFTLKLRAQLNNATAPNFHGSLAYLLLCDCFERRDIKMVLSAEQPIKETWEKPPLSDKDFWPLTRTTQQPDYGADHKAGISEQTEPNAASATRPRPRQSTGHLPAVPPPTVGLALDWSGRFAGVARGRTKIPRYVLSAMRPKLSEMRRRIEGGRQALHFAIKGLINGRSRSVQSCSMYDLTMWSQSPPPGRTCPGLLELDSFDDRR